jgi:putative addiction module CopG family antidote
MNITLPKELEDFVAAEVGSGRFSDASQVVQDALQCFQDALLSERMPEPELERMLLEARESPTTLLTSEDFESLRRRIREAAQDVS